MSFVQRRRFLWILFLAGLALLAIAANATTLSRLRFEELVRQATAVARLRCLGVESRWQDGEIWTETRFEVVELNKGLLPGIVSVRHESRECRRFVRARKLTCFSGGAKANRSACWDGHRVRFELRGIPGRGWNASRKIRRRCRSSILARGSSGTAGFATCRWRFFS